MSRPNFNRHSRLPSPGRSLVLASTSPFRRELLSRLGLAFETDDPAVDESPRKGERPTDLVCRLAVAKARAVAQRHPDSLIIGSDQVACLDDSILGKPGDAQRAAEQLAASSGKSVTFFTGLCLLNAATRLAQVRCEPFTVHFRRLTAAQIHRYLQAEKPFNCAGSFKSEGLGITLFEKMEGDDPSALIGLPLIRLVTMLASAGVQLP